MKTYLKKYSHKEYFFSYILLKGEYMKEIIPIKVYDALINWQKLKHFHLVVANADESKQIKRLQKGKYKKSGL